MGATGMPDDKLTTNVRQLTAFTTSLVDPLIHHANCRLQEEREFLVVRALGR